MHRPKLTASLNDENQNAQTKNSDRFYRHYCHTQCLHFGIGRICPEKGNLFSKPATDRTVAGVRIFDLQIALTAFDNGATEIWTHDRDFTIVPGLAVKDPLS